MKDYTALYAKFLEQTCSREEAEVLLDYFLTEQGDAELVKLIEVALERQPLVVTTAKDEQSIARNELAIMQAIRPKKYLIKMTKWYAAAAVVLISLSVWLYLMPDSDQQIRYANDIAPGTKGATLTLANGQKILIKDALAGNIASQAGVKISKTADGQIIYEVTDNSSGSVAYNTLSTSRGEQTQVRLPDGTLVSLNATSSLTYPISFSKSKKRLVSLIGEGYFEVAKDKSRPFIVKSRGQQVAVLGTHFNISAYENESLTRTTLLEGAVLVTLNNRQTEGGNEGFVELSPGKEAISTGSNLKVQDADLEEAVSWKDGYFRFNDEKIVHIMEKISRWYNIEVLYSGDITEQGFTGTISKFSNISQVLAMLEATKIVHFKIDGRRVTVLN